MEYSGTFQDNLPHSTFNSTTLNTLNWIKENREKFDWAKDPNAYEMTNQFLFGSKYLAEGKDVNIDTINEMWKIRSVDFKHCKIRNRNFVYQICKDSYESCISKKPLVNDENSHHALRKMAGLGLYLKQQKRNSQEISFNNPNELLELIQCSSSLKTFHPDLYDKYNFEKNIDVLCKLQLQNELEESTIETITNARDRLLHPKQFKQTNKSITNDSEIQK